MIQDINIFNLNLSEELNINDIKFKDLSKFISYYIKNNINFDEYEEKNFINKNEYYLDINSKYISFIDIEKMNLLIQLNIQFERGKKEFFFTGPYSIGKTFSLLEHKLNNLSDKSKKVAYYNIEVLSKEDNYFEIIAYESRHLFEKNEEWKNIFLEVLKSNLKGYFNILIKLIELIPQANSFNQSTKYIFILDQIKFKSIDKNNYEYSQISKIRQIIKKSTNYFLIGCCSINYKGVKKLLFKNWFNTNILDNNSDIDVPQIYYISTLQSGENDDNKYLNSLGNLPRYRYFKNNLDSKFINIMCKIIKKKLLKFYGDDIYFASAKLKDLQSKINISISNNQEFEKFLDESPIKFFTIDKKNNKVNYSYPLVKVAIEEIINNAELNYFNGTTRSEKGWHFERKIIDHIKTAHIISDIYIDNYYEIKSIFLKEKITEPNFDKKDNSLFYFKYCNVRRYDCALYIGNKNELLLIQIALYRNKGQIEAYNENNFHKDINSMQKFLKTNNLEVKKYFLLFIFNKDDYLLTDYEAINSNGFKYSLYDSNNSCFCKNEKNFYQINYLLQENNAIENDNEEEYIKFGKKDGEFIFNYKYDIFQYYVYKGMTLCEFIEQIFGNDIDSQKELLSFNSENFIFIKIFFCNNNRYYCDKNDSNGNEIFYITFYENHIYFGKSIVSIPFMTINLKSYDIFLKKITYDVKINSLIGFIFKNKKSNNMINKYRRK